MKPILFNSEMVNAILEGRKTQTRRPIKPQPDALTQSIEFVGKFDTKYEPHRRLWAGCGSSRDYYNNQIDQCMPVSVACKYDSIETYRDFAPYAVGDILYVRETHAIVPATAYRMSREEDGSQVPHMASPDGQYWAVYKAGWSRSAPSWKPSIHMPKWAARLFLEVTAVKAQRLQVITEVEAVAEGIISNAEYRDRAGEEGLFNCPVCEGMQVRNIVGPSLGINEIDCDDCNTAKKRYKILWDSIYHNQLVRYRDDNGNWQTEIVDLGWDVNPWVWVFEFKLVEKPAG